MYILLRTNKVNNKGLFLLCAYGGIIYLLGCLHLV